MTALTIDIRKAEKDDGSAIADVHAATWQYAYAGILPHVNLRRMINRRDANWWRRAVSRGTSILVDEMAGKIVGYATYGLNRARSLPQDGEIYELYLLPEYHGLGLGKRLFDAAHRILLDHGCNGLVVWALEENEQAGLFYRNLNGNDVAEGYECFSGKNIKKIAWVWN